MKICKNGMSNVEKIINRKVLSEQAMYRWSQFTFFYAENGHYLIRSTMTGEVIELTEAEWRAAETLKAAPQSYAFLMENGLKELAVKRFIVETDYDEVKQYQQTVFLLKTIAGKKKGLSNYVIFPTTGCNARCVYCYEEGYTVRTMTEKTADRLVDFICETRSDEPVLLRWFGGEPLAAAQIIRYICRKLQERGVPYRSAMTSNASLLTKEMAQEARSLWHLERIQVSLDGAKEDYTVRKAYCQPEKYNYDGVMRAIHYLADEDIQVNLRVNVDYDNISGIEGFFRDIKTEFGDMNRITLYLAPLYQAQKTERIIELYKEIFRLTALQKEIGIPLTKRSSKNEGLRLNHCMADSMESSIVITPEGVFNNCEHLPEGHTWGNIFEGVTDQELFAKLSKPMEIDTQCRKCAFLPQCKPFYKNGCPGWFEKCFEYQCLKTEFALHSLSADSNTEAETDYSDEEISGE